MSWKLLRYWYRYVETFFEKFNFASNTCPCLVFGFYLHIFLYFWKNRTEFKLIFGFLPASKAILYFSMSIRGLFHIYLVEKWWLEYLMISFFGLCVCCPEKLDLRKIWLINVIVWMGKFRIDNLVFCLVNRGEFFNRLSIVAKKTISILQIK